MVCRGLLLMLHRAGEIELPEVRFVPRNPLVVRERPAPVLIDTTPIIASPERAATAGSAAGPPHRR